MTEIGFSQFVNVINVHLSNQFIPWRSSDHPARGAGGDVPVSVPVSVPTLGWRMSPSLALSDLMASRSQPLHALGPEPACLATTHAENTTTEQLQGILPRRNCSCPQIGAGWHSCSVFSLLWHPD